MSRYPERDGNPVPRVAVSAGDLHCLPRSRWHGMDDDRILALEVEDSDLKQSAVRHGADEHRALVSDVLADRVVYRMLDVLVRDSVPARGPPLPTRVAQSANAGVCALGCVQAQERVPRCAPRGTAPSVSRTRLGMNGGSRES